MKKAIILFSGGLDSTTTLAIAKAQGYQCYALTIVYGQRHRSEINAAKKIAKLMAVIEHKILNLPLDEIKGSSLTDHDLAVPDYGTYDTKHIANTYVPARNTIMLSYALAWGEVIGAHDIFYGANIIDYSNYPDCRPEYIATFEKLATLATKAGVEGQAFKIHAPLLHLTKAEIIKEGLRYGVDHSLTVSCYRADAEGRACGKCDCCVFRQRGFAQAGIIDTTRYY